MTATDDDIKKYYRKQAVLVHPDKVSILLRKSFFIKSGISCHLVQCLALQPAFIGPEFEFL